MERKITVMGLIVLAIVITGCIDEKPNGKINNVNECSEWRMFQHDAQRTGFSDCKAPNTNNTLWVFKTHSGVSSSPAVSDGVVFIGSDDDNIYAIDENKSKEIWKFETGGEIGYSPAVSENMIFIGSSNC